MKFSKKSNVDAKIPTSSLPDIIFMLLIFFMVTTVLRTVEGLVVQLPAAEKLQKVESRRHIAYVFVQPGGVISIDDQLLQKEQISGIMYQKMTADPQMIISLKIDVDVEMGVVTGIHEELRKGGALRINYATRTKST